ncbi:MAG: ABC transporter substrate-binding protein [Acidobacteria bacterium]|nr:MAG: ABC transporter substrate-binding protein [Acidobacteriota bacterium]
MFKLTLKNLWAYRTRLALTGVAVVLGVAFMAGTMVLTDTMKRSFDAVFETTNAGVDLVVQRPQPVGANGFSDRQRVDSASVDEVRAIKGVDNASGSILGMTQLVNKDGTVNPPGDIGGTVGVNWIDDERLNPLRVESGRAPVADNEVLIDKATMVSHGYQVGEKVTLLAKGRPVTLDLVGVATFGELDGPPGTVLAAVNDQTAQALFAQPGQYDSIVVAAEKGTDIDVLVADVENALGAGNFEVMTGAQDTARRQDDLHQELGFFNTFLMAFAIVSLFVGTFIIYNTFSILVAQRTKESAMLRAIGANKRQLLWSTASESAAVGVVAGAIGLGLGIAMSFGLKAMVGAAGFDVPDGGAVIAARTVIAALSVGVGVTVISAVGPAMRAGRVRPMAALRDVAIERTGASVVRTVVGIVMTVGGVAAFAGGIIATGEGSLSLIAIGFLVTVLGFFVLGPVIARPVIRVLAMPISLWGGTTGELARENATRSPKRTAATASALMVGVALVGFITILAASTKVSVDEAIGNSMRADFVVETGARGEGGFSPDLAERLEALPEVATVSSYRFAPAEIEGNAALLDAARTETIGDVFDLNVKEGAIEDVRDGSIAVVKSKADKQGLRMGDTVHVRFAADEVDLKIAAIYDANFPEGGYLVDIATMEAHVADQYDSKIFMAIAGGESADQVRPIVEETIREYPNAKLADKAAFTRRITEGIDAILNMVYGLLTLAVMIALIGIANTLALSVHERTREIGLLRAVGMTKRQVRLTVRLESMLIALLGVALGTCLALGLAWGIVKALEPNVNHFVVPPIEMLAIAAVAAAAGVFAGLGPARRASKLNVLDAIGTN